MTHHRTKTERSKVVITWVQQWQIGTSLWLLPASWEQTGILGTPPTNQETWFRAYLKSPPIFCEHLLEPDGWILLSQGKQARSINHAKKKGKWCGFYFFNFKLFRGSSRRQQFESWVIKWENRGVSHEYSNMHTPQELLNILVEIMTE